MATTDEVLFSLEVVVEKLFVLPQMTCRFPAVAVKLLDFPAFTIDYLDPEHVQRLRDKLSIDPQYTIGPQITELKHNDGCFHFEKGKSCLCKICPEELRQHLSSTPMYMLVLDAFFKPPRLVGTCILPLVAAVDFIYDELLKEGMSVPATFGEKRLLRVSNLMGTDIGEMAVTYRLTSLGAVLLSHIPLVGADAKRIENVDDETKVEILSGNLGAMNHVRVVADLTINSLPRPELENVEEHEAAGAAAAMTLESAARKANPPPTVQPPIAAAERSSHGTQTNVRLSSVPIEFDDCIIGSVFCPPPLYYCGLSGEEALSVPLRRRVGEQNASASPVAESWSSEDTGGDVRSTAVRVIGRPAGAYRNSAAAATSAAVGRSGVDASQRVLPQSEQKARCHHHRCNADSCVCRSESGCPCLAPGHGHNSVAAAAAATVDGTRVFTEAIDAPRSSGVDGSAATAQFPVLGSLLQELVGGLRHMPALVAESLAMVRDAAALNAGSGLEATTSQHLLPLLVQAAGHFAPYPDSAAPAATAAAESASSAAKAAMVMETATDLRTPVEAANATATKNHPPVVRRAGSSRYNREGGDPGSSSRSSGGGGGTLAWGSTRTQKLRLFRTNPEALQRLESFERQLRVKRIANSSRGGRSRSLSASAAAATAASAAAVHTRQQQQRQQPSAATDIVVVSKKQTTASAALREAEAARCTTDSNGRSINTAVSTVAAATAMLGAAAVAFAAAAIGRAPAAAFPAVTATISAAAASTALPGAGTGVHDRGESSRAAATTGRDGGGGEGRSVTGAGVRRRRTSLEVHVPAAAASAPLQKPRGGRRDSWASGDDSDDSSGAGRHHPAAIGEDGCGRSGGWHAAATPGSSAATSPAMVRLGGGGLPDSGGDASDTTEPDELKQYRLQLQRMTATTASTAVAVTLPAKVSSASHQQQQQKQQPKEQLKDPGLIGVAVPHQTTAGATDSTRQVSAVDVHDSSEGSLVASDSYNRQKEEMSKITEQSEPEGSYSDDSFDSDISKSVSLPVTGDISDVESPHRLHGSDQYTDVPIPRTSQASPVLHNRPSNTAVQSRSNPALHRSNSQQEGKPPLSSRSRGVAGSADSSRASVRASDATGQSVSRGEGGGQPTPDPGDSDSSYRALRARNEERRRRLAKSLRDDMNTDSVSSYDPSDRGPGSASPAASEDWSLTSSAGGTNLKAALTLSRLAPANKLGYTT